MTRNIETEDGKKMSDDNFDRFQDIVNTATGIFDGSALGDHDSVRAAVRKEGVVLEFICQGCNKGQQVLLEWPEIVSLKYGVDPAYAYRNRQNIVRSPMSLIPDKEEGAWKPADRCDRCAWFYGIRVFFNEPERWLEQARRAGYINPNAELQLSQYVQGLANAAAGQMARR